MSVAAPSKPAGGLLETGVQQDDWGWRRALSVDRLAQRLRWLPARLGVLLLGLTGRFRQDREREGGFPGSVPGFGAVLGEFGAKPAV